MLKWQDVFHLRVRGRLKGKNQIESDTTKKSLSVQQPNNNALYFSLEIRRQWGTHQREPWGSVSQAHKRAKEHERALRKWGVGGQ